MDLYTIKIEIDNLDEQTYNRTMDALKQLPKAEVRGQRVLPQCSVMRAEGEPLPPAHLTAIVEWLDAAEREAETSAKSFSMSHMERSEACSYAMARAYRIAKDQILTIAGGNGA